MKNNRNMVILKYLEEYREHYVDVLDRLLTKGDIGFIPAYLSTTVLIRHLLSVIDYIKFNNTNLETRKRNGVEIKARVGNNTIIDELSDINLDKIISSFKLNIFGKEVNITGTPIDLKAWLKDIVQLTNDAMHLTVEFTDKFYEEPTEKQTYTYYLTNMNKLIITFEVLWRYITLLINWPILFIKMDNTVEWPSFIEYSTSEIVDNWPNFRDDILKSISKK